jgi:hypothetical protein
MGGLTGEELLGRPVRFRGIELGRAVELLVDLDAGRALGFDVHCGDGSRRFLPLAATAIAPESLDVRSALLLVDDVEAYRRKGRPLSSLRGVAVRRAGRTVAMLTDVVVGPDGAIEEVVAGNGESTRVPLAGVEISARHARVG